MKSFGLTDKGAIRKDNQDCFILEKCEAKGCLIAGLCDGMGGAKAGGIASQLANKAFVSYIYTKLSSRLPRNVDYQRILSDACAEANGVSYEYSHFDKDFDGMGTTIVVCWVIGKTAHVAWCGDSRCYVYKRKKGLQRLTIDHSYVQELIDKGELTEEEAFNHPENNIITRGLGDFQAYPTADIVNFDIKRGDTIMLCSDGLCGYCTDEEMEKVMKENYQDVDADCEKLMQLAMDAGGQDNITVLIASLIGDKDSCPPKPKKSFFSRLFG